MGTSTSIDTTSSTSIESTSADGGKISDCCTEIHH